MRKGKILDIILLCLKIVLPILIVIPLVFFSYRLIEGRLEDLANVGDDGYHSGIGLYIFASYVLLFPVNVILTIVGGVGLLIAKKYKTCPTQRKNVIAFRCLTLAPAVSQLLYIVIILIVMGIT